MEPYFELGDNAEVAASSAQGPEQIGVLARVAAHDGRVGGDEGEGFDVVAGEAKASSQPPCAAAENQARGSGVRDNARGKDQAGWLRRVVNRSEETTAGECGAASGG